jgi:hypothetical protein
VIVTTFTNHDSQGAPKACRSPKGDLSGVAGAVSGFGRQRRDPFGPGRLGRLGSLWSPRRLVGHQRAASAFAVRGLGAKEAGGGSGRGRGVALAGDPLARVESYAR